MPTQETAAPQASHAVLWTVQECARFLGRSPRWIWSALTRRPEEPGSIPHVRVGHSPRFFPDDIADWVRAGCPPVATFHAWRAAKESHRNPAR